MEEDTKKQEELTSPELLKTILFLTKRGLVPNFVGVFLGLILKLAFHINIPDILLIVAFIYAIVNSIFLYLETKVVKTLSASEKVYFIFAGLNLIMYTFILHYTGGIEWVAIILFFVTVIEANFILPKNKSMIITCLATTLCCSVFLLEYFGIVPHYRFFTSTGDFYKNTFYVFLTMGFGCIFELNYIGSLVASYSKTFRQISNDLRNEKRKLTEAYAKLENVKSILAEEVKARTNELEAEKTGLEEKVKQRTSDLQEKIEEMEKIQKITLGRELKMIELKKEVDKLKEENQSLLASLEKYQINTPKE